jgi:hypothetical protein
LAALAAVSAAFSLLLVPAAAALSRPVREAVAALLRVGYFTPLPWRSGAAGAAAVILVPVTLLALAVFLTAWRLRLHSWPLLASCLLAIAGTYGYLAADNPAIRLPLTLEKLSPGYPGAEESFNVLMRYSTHGPLGKAFRAPTFKGAYPDWKDAKSLVACRAEIEEHWRELAPLRAWWSEVNAFDRIGDRTAVDGDLIPFMALRAVAQHGTGIARMQALDGHGDEAVATLVPIIQVARKLQPSSRTTVRTMVSVFIERLGVEAADFVVMAAPVSQAARASLAAALEGGDPKAGARHLVATNYAYCADAWVRPAGDVVGSYRTSGDEPGWARLLLNTAGPFIYNPRATLNLLGGLDADLQDCAVRRQLSGMASRIQRFEDMDARPRFKNMLGTMMLAHSMVAYTKITENYWRVQDERAALLARLKAL